MSKYIDVEPIIEWAKDPTANLPYGASGVDWERKIFNAPTIDIDLADDGMWSNGTDGKERVVDEALQGILLHRYKSWQR